MDHLAFIPWDLLLWSVGKAVFIIFLVVLPMVSYAVYAQTKDRFDATVTIANRDRTTIKNWNLWFLMQGDQIVKPKAAGSFKLDQQGRQVNVTSNAVLDAKKTVTLDISGRFLKSNSAPLVFQLGDQKCETYVSTAPGQPSRPVERLSNGQIRLGPPITRPVPGLRITPGGQVVPLPGPVKSDEPVGGSTSQATDDPTVDPTQTIPICEAQPDIPECDIDPSPETQTSEPTTGGGDETATPPDTQPPTTLPTDNDDHGDDTTGGTGGTGADTTTDETGGTSPIPPPSFP